MRPFSESRLARVVRAVSSGTVLGVYCLRAAFTGNRLINILVIVYL